jgi:hypothetical protein
MPQDNARRVEIVNFVDGFEITKSDLDRAIGGGLKRAGLSSASQIGEEVVSSVYFKLVRYFAQGKTPAGTISSLAWKIALRTAIDTYRRPDSYSKRRSYSVDVADVRPMADAPSAAQCGAQIYLARESVAQSNSKIAVAVRSLSAVDRNALIDAIDRKTALQRTTKEAIKRANLISQREKRAKDRLVKAYRACNQER